MARLRGDEGGAWWLVPGRGRDYERVAAAIRFVAGRRAEQPSLDDVAAHVGLSRYRLQRIFVRWAGVSPKQFLAHLNLLHAGRRLAGQASLLDTALASGLSGPSRLHDLFVTLRGMTPGEYRARGAGVAIHHAVVQSALGPLFAMVTRRGICGLQFVDGSGADRLLAEARAAWPKSRFSEDIDKVVEGMGRLLPERAEEGGEVRLLVRGTRFQINVWEALLRIPPGLVSSYSAVAAAVGAPRAARAVAGAVARNPVAVLIPCHRVLRANGALSGYRWGEARQELLLARELTVGHRLGECASCSDR